MATFLFVWFIVLGLSIGSFLNVVIFRLPLGFHLSLPSRSACMKCRRKLRWYENIPLLSYLGLRGKCSGCQRVISARYPLVESMVAVLFLAVYLVFGLNFTTFYYCVFLAALVAITFIDLDHRIIPDSISLPGIVIGFIGSIFVPELGPVSSLFGILIGGGFFWFMGWAYEKIRGQEGLGFGDVKLLAMIGAFIGPRGTLSTIVISSVFGSVVGLILMIAHKKDLKLSLPYGPFLAIGAMTFLFWSDYLAIRLS
jgi:leader peptidase (prepilin peptidase)/N-methyltransferase